MATAADLTSLALKVLPLALGAAVSPLVLVGQMVTLSQGGAGLRPGWSYAAGTAVVVALWLALGLAVGAALPPHPSGPDPVSAGLHLMLALVLVAIGARILSRSAAPAEANTAPPPPVSAGGHTLRHAFLLGLGAMAANLTSLVLVLPASEMLSRSSLPGGAKALLVLAVALITLLPSLVPPLALALAGASGRRALERFSAWSEAHQRQITASLCFGFALLLAWSGLGLL
ncbi:MAG: hypothetical protein DCF23_07355 [Cyanobium sp.]|nr:MAG: hypothetical protein DCF23_07355 [Cyanobium sp.]